MTIKAKEPWLAVLLSYILPGFGQIYAGRMYRGLLLTGGSVISILGLNSWLNFIVSPYTRVTKLHWLGFIATGFMVIGFHIFSMIDAYTCARQHNRDNEPGPAPALIKVLAVAGLLVMLIFLANYLTPLVQYYKYNYYVGISLGDSMRPGIENEDIVLDKYVTDYVPQRGEIIAFKSPRNKDENYCKRVIGVPGDMVEIRAKEVFLNKQRLLEPYIRHNDSLDFSRFSDEYLIPRELKKRDEMAPVIVAAGTCFVLGANRDLSDDSRYFGMVPLADVRCVVIKIIWPPQRAGIIQ
ncbi:MAG: signal peptidase I [bacterium]|nr:signal peptidase I [bacterium]